MAATLKQIGSIWILLGVVIAIPALISVIYSEWYSVLGFIISGLSVSGIGLIIYRSFRKTADSFMHETIIIVSVGFLSISLMGSLPFYLISLITPIEAQNSLIPAGSGYSTSSLVYFRNPLHCFFESMSAFTTTGLTMAVHEPSIGKGLLFYRSLAQWVGGLGFIVMILSVFRQNTSKEAILLFHSDSSTERLKPRIIQTVRTLWQTYFIITAFNVIYLFAGTLLILRNYPAGDALFDAINHAMTAQSTGGFSTLDDSIAGYGCWPMEALHILPMILGSFSLPFFYRLIHKKSPKEFWLDIQTRTLLFAFIAGSAILIFLLSRSGNSRNSFIEGSFQYVSALSTTGWQTVDISKWNNGLISYLIFFAMIIGGAAGATVGGIKIIRILIIEKGLKWQINKFFLSANTIKSVKFNGKHLLPEDMNAEFSGATSMALLFMLILFGSTIIISQFNDGNAGFYQLLFESASAQATVGLSCGITDPSMNPVVESIFIFQMWAGRLEILPVLALFRIMIWGTKPKAL